MNSYHWSGAINLFIYFYLFLYLFISTTTFSIVAEAINIEMIIKVLKILWRKRKRVVEKLRETDVRVQLLSTDVAHVCSLS